MNLLTTFEATVVAVIVVTVGGVVNTGSNTDSNTDGQCIWYGQCGSGKNCEYNGAPKNLTDQTVRQLLVSVCPDLKDDLDNNGLCCDATQMNTLSTQIQQAKILLGGCPACFRNFAQLFCQSTCSPQQANFMTVDSASDGKVDSVSYYVSETFASDLYVSCSGLTAAVQLMCAATKCNVQKFYDGITSHSPFTMKIILANSTITIGDQLLTPMEANTIPCDQATPEGQSACPCNNCPATCNNPSANSTQPTQQTKAADVVTSVSTTGTTTVNNIPNTPKNSALTLAGSALVILFVAFSSTILL